jgi:hypothetical protein
VPEGGAHVVVLAFEAVEPIGLISRDEVRLRQHGEVHEVAEVAPEDEVEVAVRDQPVASIPADRLQHPVARGSTLSQVPDETVLHQHGDPIEGVKADLVARVTDGFDRLERAATREHGQAGEESLLLGT